MPWTDPFAKGTYPDLRCTSITLSKRIGKFFVPLHVALAVSTLFRGQCHARQLVEQCYFQPHYMQKKDIFAQYSAQGAGQGYWFCTKPDRFVDPSHQAFDQSSSTTQKRLFHTNGSSSACWQTSKDAFLSVQRRCASL